MLPGARHCGDATEYGVESGCDTVHPRVAQAIKLVDQIEGLSALAAGKHVLAQEQDRILESVLRNHRRDDRRPPKQCHVRIRHLTTGWEQ